jgi:hypothetical protein
MKRIQAMLMAAILATGSLAGSAAWADRGYYRPQHHHYPRHHGHALGWGLAGLAIGSAALWAATRPEPAPVMVPAPVYVPEPVYQPPVALAPPQDGWWYYCRAAGAYYPYVSQCVGGWERVAPRPGY